MPIAAQCPTCGKNLKVRIQAAGKTVKCPGCGADIAVPNVRTRQRAGMDTGQDRTDPPFLDQLQFAAKRYSEGSTLSTLRGAGIGSIVWGMVAVFLGFSNADVHPLNAVLGVFGVVLIVEGIWVSIQRSAGCFIVDGIALIMLGIWNFFMTIVNGAESGSPQMWWACLGAFQIAWGVQSMRKYGKVSRLSRVTPAAPTAEAEKWIEVVVKELKSAKPKEDSRVIEAFKHSTSPFSMGQAWRCQLRDDCVVVVQTMGGEDVSVLPRDGFSLEISYPNRPGKKLPKILKCRFLKGKYARSGQEATIPSYQAERYEQWRARVATEPPCDVQSAPVVDAPAASAQPRQIANCPLCEGEIYADSLTDGQNVCPHCNEAFKVAFE